MASVREKFAALLLSAQDRNKPVSLYHAADGDGSKFEVGYITSVTDDDLTLSCLNARGELDGSLVIRLDDVDVVETDDPYTRKIELLHQYLGSVFKTQELVRGDSFEGQLKRACDDRLILTAEDDRGHRFTGFVKEFDDEYFALELINAYGSPEGEAVIQKGCVVKLEVDRRDEQARGFLYRYNHELKRLIEP